MGRTPHFLFVVYVLSTYWPPCAGACSGCVSQSCWRLGVQFVSWCSSSSSTYTIIRPSRLQPASQQLDLLIPESDNYYYLNMEGSQATPPPTAASTIGAGQRLTAHT